MSHLQSWLVVALNQCCFLLIAVPFCPHAIAQIAPTVSGEPPHVTERAIKESQQRLRQVIESDLQLRVLQPSRAAPAALSAPEATLPLPQQASLAELSTLSFRNPDEIRSIDSELRVTLVAMKTHGTIGDDPVFLRSYNGKLVGPTLRAKPGDRLRITLKNDLDPEVHHTNSSNSLHLLNTTNLHTHGLHVSPNGISDNVLLEVDPRATQEYEILVPSDHPAGTFWYHAHRHGSTAVQVGSGMSGALIIEGGMDAVPEIKAARERVFVLQQIPYCYKNKFTSGGLEIACDLPEGVIELPYANDLFAPRVWGQLERFTTINGDRLPVLRVRPGAVERWRFVHSGTREVIAVKLERSTKSAEAAPATLDLNEIARDGLALGCVSKVPKIELYPGYRSDVLFAAPKVAGAEYLLVDDSVSADKSISGEPKPRRFLARIVIEGAELPMNLPADTQLTAYRPTSLGNPTENPVDPEKATIIYGPRPPGTGSIISIDGKKFDHDTARQVFKLHDIVERKLTAPVLHVFHIHVNPFEVISIKDDQDVERIGESAYGGKHWRDTIVLLPNWTVTIRMKLADYAGLFVQHCHILQHEDLGMMDLVEVLDPGAGGSSALKSGPVATPYAAPVWELPGPEAGSVTSAQFRGRPTIIAFYEGLGCPQCNQQISALADYLPVLQRAQIDLVGISTDGESTLREASASGKCPFPIVSDSELKVFRKFGCVAQQQPLHGIFVLDPEQRVVWQKVSTEALSDVEAIVREAIRLATP